ncbi:MAG TPA: hypothetical protein PLR99_13330 [Polyangiaceae bacterium]|nr:hypothetical protein [Polyangiaceae bacterium]
MTRNALVLAALVAGLGACSKNESESASPPPSAPPTPSASPTADKPKELTFDELVTTSAPLAPRPATQDLAGGKVSAEVCAVEGGPFVSKSHTTVLRSVRAIGDRVLVVNDEQIRAYKVEPGAACKLTIDRRFGTNGALTLDAKIERLTADGAGNVWASSGIFASYKLGRDGAVAAKCDARPLGYFFVHPSGRTGIGTFANADTAKVTLTGAACKSEKWAFTGLGADVTRKGNITNAQAVGFLGDTVFMGAKLAKAADPNESIVVLALDPSGKEKFKMGKTDKSYGSKERFGWVHAIGPCKVGVCVVDSNLRRLTAWRADGKFVGAVDLGALFGLKYPWIADFARTPDSAFFVAGQTREVKGVGEGNIYRVTGL